MASLQLLPAQTFPADEAFARRHDPRPIVRDYTVFRDCLRWEFGFTCATCLLHEHDIIGYGGTEGWGVLHIEHVVARNHDGRLVGVYGNVILICRLCNGARNDAPHIDHHGRRLLDPTKDVWSEHFRVAGDEILPAEGDADAAYTEDVYDINSPRKVKLRRNRRLRQEDFLKSLEKPRARIAHLRFREQCGDPGEKIQIITAIAEVRDEVDRLCRLANQGKWIPDDAPMNCRCGRAPARTLPATYLRQIVEIEVP